MINTSKGQGNNQDVARSHRVQFQAVEERQTTLREGSSLGMSDVDEHEYYFLCYKNKYQRDVET